MPTTWTVIINGAAGGGRAAERVDGALRQLRAGGVSLEPHFTEGPRHAIELAREAARAGARHFLAVGGDGTAYEVVNGLFPRPGDGDGDGAGADPIILGMLPLGTGNSFLRDFDITSAEGAIEALIGGRTRSCDVIRCEHAGGTLHYINLLSIGFSARAGALTNRTFKPLGHLGYGLAVMVSLFDLRHPSFRLRIDGVADERPCTLLSFCNSRFTGGTMMMAPHAEIDSGAIETIRVGPLSRAAFLRLFPSLYKGTHVAHPLIEEGRAERIEFLGDRAVDAMIDGEIETLRLRSLEVLPGALSVVC